MIVFYVSGHGFGHASRDIAVMNALLRAEPGLPLIVRSTVPAWFFHQSLDRRLDIQAIDTDPGIAQIDSLNLDERETARRAARFYSRFDERVTSEAAWLRSVGARAVVADVPPLACAAAALAGRPSIVFANFTWDWIYRAFERFEADAPGVIDAMERAYAAATLALRLPLYGGFEPMATVVRDIPFVARKASHPRASVRAALGLTADRPIVLASFGGHSLRMPYAQVARQGRLRLVLTTFEAEATGGIEETPGLTCLTPDDLAARRLHYEDLVAAADVVVSKPGYGIVSECIANGASLLYTSRGRMAEYDVFVRDMPRVLRCRYITQEALLAGQWADAIDALLKQPVPSLTPGTDGAEIAASAILDTANRR